MRFFNNNNASKDVLTAFQACGVATNLKKILKTDLKKKDKKDFPDLNKVLQEISKRPKFSLAGIDFKF